MRKPAFSFLFGASFNPKDVYSITLAVLDPATSAQIDSVSITVNAPEPGTVARLLGGFAVAPVLGRRRSR